MPRKKIKEEIVSIKIPMEMEPMIEEFLRSREATELRLGDVSDLVTKAIRKLLEEHGYCEKKE